MFVIVSPFGQPDKDQRKQTGEETAWLRTVVVLPDAVTDKKALKAINMAAGEK